MTANFQIRVFGHGTENFKKYSVHIRIHIKSEYPYTMYIVMTSSDVL